MKVTLKFPKWWMYFSLKAWRWKSASEKVLNYHLSKPEVIEEMRLRQENLLIYGTTHPEISGEAMSQAAYEAGVKSNKGESK